MITHFDLLNCNEVKFVNISSHLWNDAQRDEADRARNNSYAP